MKIRVVFVVTIALLLMAGTAAAQTEVHQDARAIVERLATKMNAQNVRTIQITGNGTTRAYGQQFIAAIPERGSNVGDDFPTLAMPGYSRVIDYESMYSHEELTRAQGENAPRGGGGQPIQGEQRQVRVNHGNFAWNMQGDTVQPQPTQAEARLIEIYLTPYGFIKGALAAEEVTAATMMMNGSDTPIGKQAGQNGMRKVTYISYQALGKYTIFGSMDENDEIERIYTWIGDPVMGDVNWGYDYMNWRDFDGFRHPARLHSHWGDIRNLPHHGTEVMASEIRFNVPVPAVTVPDAVRTATMQPPAVQSEELAPGVWRIAGGSHHSIAVEFRDFITVVEAPQNEARSLAVIQEVQRLIPNKPIRYLVVTHSHFDHIGGVRTYVAHGTIIVAHEALVDFLDQLVLYPYPRTIQPDLLSTYYPRFLPNKEPVFEPVSQRAADGRKVVLSDGERIMEFHTITGLQHAGDMIVAYLPQQKMLVHADMYTPPAPGAQPPAPTQSMTALRNNIQRLGLDVAQHVPIHGPIGTHEQFLNIVARPAND